MLYYDYVLTFTDEVELFWFNRRLSWASFFFFANRYVSLGFHILVIFLYYHSMTKPVRSYTLSHKRKLTVHVSAVRLP